MKKGYTKAWRKELNSDVWMMPPIYHRIWFWIRQKVQHEAFLFPTPKFGIWVLPGQRLTSYQEIAEGVKWTEWGKEVIPNKKTVKMVLDSLELWGMIKAESNAKGTLIIVMNWDIYNGVTIEESNAEETLTGLRSGHKEECKRIIKNVEEEGRRIIPYQEILDAYNKFCPSLPKARELTDARKKAIRSRYLKYENNLGGALRVFDTLFKKAEISDFLTGRSKKWRIPEFDWLLNERNMVKVLEGGHDNISNKKEGLSDDFKKTFLEEN